MTEVEMMQLICWQSMAGGAAGGSICIGRQCTAWEWYDRVEYKYIGKDEPVPEGFTLSEGQVSTSMTFRCEKTTRTGEGGCGAIPVCNGCEQ